MLRAFRAAFAVLLTTLVLPATAGESAPLRFGMIESPLHTQSDLQPVADWIASRIGRPVELVTAADYPDLSARTERGEIDVAILFPVAVAQALSRVPPVTVLACSIRQGKPTYRGYFITRQESAVRTLADLKGTRIAFVDRGSTSGYFYPVQVLKKEGLVRGEADLASFFGAVSFLGSHEKVLKAVAAGEADAGTAYDLGIRRSVDAGVDPGAFRIIGRTDEIPHEAVAARFGLDPAVAAKVRDALLELDTRTDAGRRVLKPMATQLNGFAPCDASVFDAVRTLLAEKEAPR